LKEGKVPGPVSDSYDPEFGTSARATEVRTAIEEVRKMVSEEIDNDELQDIVELAERLNTMTYPNGRAPGYNETELRIIRFCLNRAIESI
jgi:hypothetical protein